MSRPDGSRPVLLVVGGCGGLVGRAVLAEFSGDHRIRSVHRHSVPAEATQGVDWVPADAARVPDWGPMLEGVDAVLNLAWYRHGSARRFRPLAAGLLRLIAAAQRADIPRFVHVSVPDAPASLESGLPYLAFKRTIDRALEASSLAYAIVRPTMLFGDRDRLLTVMLRTMSRYRRFPMFGNGLYHVSPLAAKDLARIVRQEMERGGRTNRIVGGPQRWVYRSLTDRMFELLGLAPRYVGLSPANSVRLARLMETLGSSRLYAYEVEWLLSDRLGPPPYEGLSESLGDVEPFLRAQATLLTGRASEAAA